MDTTFSIADCCLIDVPTFTDARGSISVLDKELPFEVRRIFWLHNVAAEKDRGGHALLYGSEIMIAVHGSFVVDLEDAETKTSILLDDPSRGLIIRPGIWFRTHSYKDAGVSLILASENYSRDKYTYDYEEYKRLRK